MISYHAMGQSRFFNFCLKTVLRCKGSGKYRLSAGRLMVISPDAKMTIPSAMVLTVESV